MIAPRQGLFASLLIISFALHTVFLVIATTHQLNLNRDSQGQLMAAQIVSDSVAELAATNTVSLALLAERYASNPSVAAIRILNAQSQVLATAGQRKTRSGQLFIRDVVLNNQKIGRVEVTLIQPSAGEILRTQWLAILVFFVLHGGLWLAYRQIARPNRAELMAQKNLEAFLKHEIAQLTAALSLEKNNADALMQQLQQQQVQGSNIAASTSDTTVQVLTANDDLALNIQFYDPKQLMQTLSASLSVSYCNLCQQILQHTVLKACAYYELAPENLIIVQKMNTQGAILRIHQSHKAAAACLLLIGAVFQEIMDVMYKRYRESRRFALQSRFALACALPSMQLSAEQAAISLCQLLLAKEAMLYLDDTTLTALQHDYQFEPMPNPSNALTRQAMVIMGLCSHTAQTVQSIRDEILKGQKST